MIMIQVIGAPRLSADDTPVWIRHAPAPGLNGDIKNVEGVAEFLATFTIMARVEILPFHKMGQHKVGD